MSTDPTADHRRASDRRGLLYPSDLKDAEWALAAPLIPPDKHGERKRTVDRISAVMSAVDYNFRLVLKWLRCYFAESSPQ